MFCRRACQPPPCLCASFFLSVCISKPGNRWASFEPITQFDPLIITNLSESLIWSLPNSALSVHKVGFVSKQEERDKETARRRGGRKRIICTHLHTCLWGSQPNLKEDGSVGGSVFWECSDGLIKASSPATSSLQLSDGFLVSLESHSVFC